MIVCTSDCEECSQSTINDSDKARVMVYCKYKDKSYYYGQCVPCDYEIGSSKRKCKSRNNENDDDD